MSAGSYNMVCEQGATFSLTLTWKDENDAAVNLTGYSARMKVKDRLGGTEILSLTSPSGGIVLGGAAGTITITVSATDTAALTIGGYIYDLELESGSGVVTRLLEGEFRVCGEVTV